MYHVFFIYTKLKILAQNSQLKIQMNTLEAVLWHINVYVFVCTPAFRYKTHKTINNQTAFRAAFGN